MKTLPEMYDEFAAENERLRALLRAVLHGKHSKERANCEVCNALVEIEAELGRSDAIYLHNAIVREGRQAEALRELQESARLEPANARYAYVYAVALHHAERDALKELLAGIRFMAQECSCTQGKLVNGKRSWCIRCILDAAREG